MEVDATRAGGVSPLRAGARVQQALGGQDEWRLMRMNSLKSRAMNCGPLSETVAAQYVLIILSISN